MLYGTSEKGKHRVRWRLLHACGRAATRHGQRCIHAKTAAINPPMNNAFTNYRRTLVKFTSEMEKA